jgi:transketolase
LAQQLRVDSIRASNAAGSGHPTSSMSAAELVAVLFAHHLHYDFEAPESRSNDHLVFSKGHASPLLYASFKAAGAISDDELLTYRKLGSRLEGHPTPRLPWVDVATGSLGFGLPVAVGLALTGKRLDRMPYRVWVLCGDSEMSEGSIWEAFEHAAHEGLDNLTVAVDVNRLGQRGETMHGWDLASYTRRAEACGWHAIEIDGHEVEEIDAAYAEATRTRGQPTVIVARTHKGRGATEVEDQPGVHGQPLADPEKAIAELGGERHLLVNVARPRTDAKPHVFATGGGTLPRYEPGSNRATRQAYGEGLAALGSVRGDVVALDSEVSNSTYAEYFAHAHQERYFEMYIAEQQMVAAAVGMQVNGWTPFASTFAAFFSRAFDIIRMAAVSRARLCLVGSHAGVSIGADGPSQMGLEDLAMFRAVHGSVVLYPCDANQTVRLVEAMADLDGIGYLRTTRGNTPVIYHPDEAFPIGGSKLLRSSPADRVTVVAGGVTVHEALKAAVQLAAEDLPIRLIDAYSVKPLDAASIATAAQATCGRVVVVEDHWVEGGLGEAVSAALSTGGTPSRIRRLAVTEMPASGTPDEQMHLAGIDAEAIADAVRALSAS